jgi:putative transport protein
MDVGTIWGTIADAAAENPVLLVAILLGIGSLFGEVKIRGIALGPAAVLFTALALSASDPDLILPAIVGTLGLALFAYTVGLAAGPSFFGLLKRGSRVIVYTAIVLVVAGALTAVLSHLAGLDGGLAAGIYAGAITNTPALAAASEQIPGEGPIVGYSLTYLYGVLGMLAAATLALRAKVESAQEEDAHLITRNVRVERSDLTTVGALIDVYGGRVKFSRIMRGDEPGHEGKLDVATDDVVPVRGDILTVVGDPDTVGHVTVDLGHTSTVALDMDRRRVDFRRLTVSNPKISGIKIADLRLERTYGATATRVRRGDVDLLATDDLPLLIGDRVRVVAPRDKMAEVAAFFGDSETRASHVNAAGLGLGMSIGILFGLLRWPLPGGTTFSLGVAGGALLVGLVLGRTMRTGPIVWSLPTPVSSAIGQLGMLLFLAYAGSTAGPALKNAFGDDEVWFVLGIGVIVTTAVGAAMLILGRMVGKLDGPMAAGTIAGTATQPAVLAQANAVTGSPRVNLGYALVYPAAMIVKVIVAPLVGTLFFF